MKLSFEQKNLIAFKVARQWLRFASRTIAAGGRPARLTAIAYDSVVDHFRDLDEEKFPSPSQISEIAGLAVQEAKHFFFLGYFHDVKEFYSNAYQPKSEYAKAAAQAL